MPLIIKLFFKVGWELAREGVEAPYWVTDDGLV